MMLLGLLEEETRSGRVRAQGDGAADRPQSARAVVAAKDEELWAGQGSFHGADDSFSGVSPADLVPSSGGLGIAMVHSFHDQTFDAAHVGPGLQPLPGGGQVGGHGA